MLFRSLLHDDGVAPDQAAGDGVFSASWTPAGSAGVAATFHYPGGSQTVALPRILLSDSAPVDLPAGVSGRAVSANISIAYRQQFGASGGITPYLWSVAAGSLPPGLSLNGATGAISGTPSATGNYPFTVRVADNLGFSDSAAWSIVVSQGLQAGWPKTLKAKAADGWIPTVNSSPVFADLDGDGKQELIVGDLNTLYVFKGGTLSARYDFPSNVKLTATPAVADLFNDGRKQIIVNVNYPSATPPLYAFDKDLNLLPGFPAGDYQSWNGTPGYCGSPVVADFDNDGKKSILLECAPNNIHPELVKLIGRLKYRTSFGQNALQHSKEVALLMGVMADEIGLDPKISRRIGILHDIGKALDQQIEGTHAKLGADMARKFGETEIVIQGIEAHHEEVEKTSLYGVLAAAADAISAARPGARRETLEIYVKRLEKLESIANEFKGVEKSFAIQAGREIRIIVQPEKISDNDAVVLARDIRKKIEEGMEYPGQVKVTVIRETRVIEYAK